MTNPRRSIPLLALALTTALTPLIGQAADPLPVVAIVKLDSDEADKSLASGLTEALATALFDTKKFTVVERSQVSRVMQEQSLGQAGVLKEGSEPQLGQLLGAQKLVVGRVTRIGTYWQADVRLIDAATANVDRSGATQFAAASDLSNAARQVIGLLMGSSTTVADAVLVKRVADDVAARLSSRIHGFTVKVATVEKDRVTFPFPADTVVFPKMRLALLEAAGFEASAEVRGACIVESVDGSRAKARCVSDPTPDEDEQVRMVPLAVSVRGGFTELQSAVTAAVSAKAELVPADTKAATPVTLELTVGAGPIGRRKVQADLRAPGGASILTVETAQTL